MEVRARGLRVRDVCEGLLTMFRPMAEKKNIDLRGQLDAGHPAAAAGRGQAAADPVQPAVQRDQVHAGGRPGAAQAEADGRVRRADGDATPASASPRRTRS